VLDIVQNCSAYLLKNWPLSENSSPPLVSQAGYGLDGDMLVGRESDSNGTFSRK